MSEYLQQLRAYIARRADVIRTVNDAIWDYAEIAHQERRSSELLIAVLRENGFSVEENAAQIPTAFLARYGHGHPVIGLLGEYDALPNLSQLAEADHAEPIAEGAPGHGCGHNLIAAGALAAALALRDWLEESGAQGTVLYYGCAAEEHVGAKAFMAREGLFDACDFTLGWHPQNRNYLVSEPHLGTMEVEYAFRGKASHAAAVPELGRSALSACELTHIGINYMREHLEGSVRIHASFKDGGGVASNIIQEKASTIINIRAPKLDRIHEIRAWADRVAEGAALMTDTEVSSQVKTGYADFDYNSVLMRVMNEAFRSAGPTEWSDDEQAYAARLVATYNSSERRMMETHQSLYGGTPERPLHSGIIPYEPTVRNGYIYGSTDAGDVSYVAPTGYVFIATRPMGAGGHTWYQTTCGKSSIAHKAVMKAGEVLALTCVEMILHPELVKAAREEWEKKYAGKYRCMMDCPLPLSEEMKSY